MKATWNVAVIYDGVEARETGVVFCDTLVQRFWSRCKLDVTWLPSESLANVETVRGTLQKTARADLLVFVVSSQNDLPLHVRGWVEEWLETRGEREGCLVALAPEGKHCGPCNFLRQLAHRAGMDFLTEVPQSFGEPIPDSVDVYSERASTVTRVLDDILKQPQAPPALP